jgi:hypothetical protein
LDFNLVLRNEGAVGTAHTVKALISTNDTSVNLEYVNKPFGDIASGETSTNTGVYRLRIDPSCPGDVDVPISLSITSEGTVFWADSFNLHVYPVLEIADEDGLLPTEFALHQNYPNPFNPLSTIRYDLIQASDVSLIIYDVLGREVARLMDRYMEPGYHQIMWDSRDASGRQVPSGIYIARLTTPEYSKSIKMLLLK